MLGNMGGADAPQKVKKTILKSLHDLHHASRGRGEKRQTYTWQKLKRIIYKKRVHTFVISKTYRIKAKKTASRTWGSGIFCRRNLCGASQRRMEFYFKVWKPDERRTVSSGPIPRMNVDWQGWRTISKIEQEHSVRGFDNDRMWWDLRRVCQNVHSKQAFCHCPSAFPDSACTESDAFRAVTSGTKRPYTLLNKSRLINASAKQAVLHAETFSFGKCYGSHRYPVTLCRRP